jgi:hypothetical protein
MNQYSILVLFKDDLSIGGKDEFPITTKSETIKQHLFTLESNNDRSSKEQFFFQFEDSNNSVLRRVEVKEICDNNFVWGWWKKPGESHNNLFKIMECICQKGEVINALLYNRYMRRIYTAEITDIYYVPYASTVSIPHKWALKCPDYYRDLPHFCGAYFSMRLKTKSRNNTNDGEEYEEYNENQIIPYKDPQVILTNYFVDRNTFDDIFIRNISVIRQTEGVIDASKTIVDKEISPLSLKLTDQTIFLLRKSTQKEKIRELFNNHDDEINNELKNLPISDAIDFIKSLSREDWKILFTLEKTIMIISDLFKNRNMPITTTDIRLVSNLVKERILVSPDKSSDELSDIEKSIIDWLLSSNFKVQREKAAVFFSLAWIQSIKKIEMPSLNDYFNILPQLEEISSSVKHINKKLYRDHLNHNIRAALMSSYLVSIINHNYEDIKLAFFSGLLHDIAHPLSSYEGTIQSIQESLIKLNITKSTITNSIINTDMIKNWVNAIAFIASIPSIKEKKIPQPLYDLDDLFNEINPKLLYEEILCSMSHEHSFLSAVVVLNTAISKVSKANDDVFNDGVKRLFANQEDYKDLFQIIQCIALHDRKAAIDYRGLSKFKQITIIDMKDFFLPVITIMADEIQEWGRPISSNEKSIVTDCDISYNNEELFILKYNCEFKKETLKEINYCFLEHFYSKIRIFSRLKNEKGNVIKLEMQINIIEGLKICTGNDYSSELKFEKNDVIWPGNNVLPNYFSEENDKRLITLISYPSDNTNVISSFIILESKQKEVMDRLKKDLYRSDMMIKNLTMSIDSCKMTINDNIFIEGEIEAYLYTEYQKESIIQHLDKCEILKKIGILVLKDVSININEENRLHHNQLDDNYVHLIPQPHFLDLDWRFNYQTIYSILNFVSTNANNGKVCYLGCPSLALYHNRQIQTMNTKFTLFDRGHYALNKWIQKGYIEKNNFVEYDVYLKIPNEYLHQYDMIIMDPPWYKDFYAMFLKRAIAFVKNNGIIGIVEYPGYPGHEEKIENFKIIRKKIFRSITISPYCSIEVAYTEPDFEKIWHEHKKFVHSAIGTYRPAYMDFYLINNTDYDNIDNKDEILSDYSYSSTNDINIEYENGYVRLKKDFENYFIDDNKWNFTTRKSLKRIPNNKSSWVGWSTNNTIINIEPQKGLKISNQAELLACLMDFEKKS